MPNGTYLQGTRLRNTCLLAICTCVAFTFTKLLLGHNQTTSRLRPTPFEELQFPDANVLSGPTLAVIVASQRGDDTGWLDAFENWSKHVYVTNDQSASLTVPKDKGREGMVYLTYIIDNYDRLPDILIFSHSKRYQWHNDDPLYDGRAVLSRLDLDYVESQGYVSLRCGWSLGCPDGIHPLVEANAPPPASDPESKEARAGSFYREAFEHLFPDTPVPEVVGAACCAQFAVTAQQIRQRPKGDYQRFRDWLLETPLNDSLSGRILEYSWHVIFGQEAVFCPDARSCYCKLYGLCGLQCENAGSCQAAYTLPKYATMPEGWPDYDWDHNWRNITEMMLRFDAENKLSIPQLNTRAERSRRWSY